MTKVYGLRCSHEFCTEEIGTFIQPEEATRKALKAGWTLLEEEFCPAHKEDAA